MRFLIAAAFLLLVGVPAVSDASARAPVHRSYPIHYDGPMVHHAHPAAAVDVTGNLPIFDVRFHGGPVQTSTVSYAIFWQPPHTYMSRTYQALIERFFKEVGGSAIYGMATSYSGSNGHVRNRSRFGGAWIDRSPYPSRGISDQDLQFEVLKATNAKNWSAGINAQFFVFTANNALPSVQFCAYHSAFEYGFPGSVQTYEYAFIPYVGNVNGCNVPFGISPNNDADADGSILNMSHEQMEMVTDPLLDAWYDPHNGEIGDICIYSFGVPIDRSGGNIVIGKDPYFLQEEYSQARGSCQPNL